MLPEAFLDRMQNMLGEEYKDFLDSYDLPKYQALRLNALKKKQDGTIAVEDETLKSFAQLTKVPWAENGYYYSTEDQPGKHPYHEAGIYYIQEPSAMAPVEFLDIQPGERVLDLCAAPGGKSTQIAAKLQGKGFLLTNEIHPARAKILSENVERMGITNACVTNETAARLADYFPDFFDKILVDAPCSGEGMFRKNDAACDEWSLENVRLCAERQDEILDCAVRMLRPGGKLVFSTCTFAPLENEGSIQRLLDREPFMKILPMQKDNKGLTGGDGNPAYIDSTNEDLKKTLRLWPHKLKGEGHYAALLQKGEDTEKYDVPPINGYEKGLAAKDPAIMEYNTFAEATFVADSVYRDTKNSKYLRFGDNLYLVPEDMPSLKGLKVMRPGLHLGEYKKNRFDPSHALALAVNPAEVKNICNMESSDQTIHAYLNGQTFNYEGEKGWYVICVDGYTIGWGKLAGGIMKNHYPKGLRK